MALQLFNDSDFFAPFFPRGHFPFERPLDASRGILVDVKETPKQFEIAADLPGLSKDEIKLQVDGDVLSLGVQKTSKREDEVKDNGVKAHRVERSAQFIKRTLRMPESADLSKIAAKYQDGVLHVDIPKRENQVERSRAIAIE